MGDPDRQTFRIPCHTWSNRILQCAHSMCTLGGWSKHVTHNT